jgi:DNA-binding NarL/FixJ family response regulator
MTDAYTRAECRHAVENLPPRQREILVKIAECKSRKVIAAELGISINTVRAHATNLFQRLRIQSDNQAVRIACASGLVPVR